MEYNYEPLSEEEAQKKRFHLMENGTYKGVVEHAEGKMSSSNNPMGVFRLRVWDNEGQPRELIDYITFAPSMVWKLRHLCDSTGLIKEFEEKKFRPELAIGKSVVVNIKTQSGKEIPLDKLNGKAPGSKYSDKNVIDDYVVQAATTNAVMPTDDFNDDVPF